MRTRIPCSRRGILPAKSAPDMRLALSPRRFCTSDRLTGSNRPVCTTHAGQAGPSCPPVLNLSHDSSQKLLDNWYTDAITCCMLPRRLTLPPHAPAELNPSPSYSCKLFCAPKKVNPYQINNFQTLFAKHRGGCDFAFTPSLLFPPSHSFASGLSVPASSLKHLVFKSLPPLCALFAVFFELPPFVFNRLQPLFAKHRGGVLCVPYLLCFLCFLYFPFSNAKIPATPL